MQRAPYYKSFLVEIGVITISHLCPTPPNACSTNDPLTIRSEHASNGSQLSL